MKFIKHLCILLALLILGIAGGTLVPRPIFGGESPSADAAPRRVLILSNPIHTDIAVPVTSELLARFGFLREGNLEIDYPGVRYLIFGWGGRAFYTETPTWADLKPLPLFRGVTLDQSVMHVALAGEIPLADSGVMALDLSDADYEQLLGFILGSFARPQGKPVPLLGQSYGRDDAFFEAVGYFNALLGCNTWTAAALRHAGLRTGWWTPLPPLLTTSLRLHNDTVTP